MLSGNEFTLINKIKDFLIYTYKDLRGYSLNKIENLSSYNKNSGLFEDKRLIIVKNVNKTNDQTLEELAESDDIFIFISENTPKVKSVKTIFIKREDSYLVDCYELSVENKKRILNEYISKKDLKISSDIYWYLIDKLDNKYVFFEKQIELIFSNKNNVDIKLINSLLSLNTGGVDKIFFDILKDNKEIINIYKNKIIDQSEMYKLFFSFKNFCLLLIESENKDVLEKNIPKYLFKEKGFLIGIYQKLNFKKKSFLLSLLFKTERSLRSESKLSLVIGLRFILNFRKIIIS